MSEYLTLKNLIRLLIIGLGIYLIIDIANSDRTLYNKIMGSLFIVAGTIAIEAMYTEYIKEKEGMRQFASNNL